MWKRAGNVQFGANVRCREVVLNGVKCTVYAEASDVDAVDLALDPKSIEVHALSDEMPKYLAKSDLKLMDSELPTKTYPPSTLQGIIEDAAKEHDDSLLPTQKYGKDK